MKKIYTNAGAQIAGKILTAIIAIFLIRILTQYLSVEWYGLYSKIYNYLSIFATIADMGLYTIAVREIARAASKWDEEEVRKISGNILTIRSLGGVAIIGIALIIALFLPGYNSHIALICIGITGIFTLFGLINSSILALLQARLKSEFSLISSVTGKIITLLGLILITYILPRESTHFAEWWLIAVITVGLIGNIVMTMMLAIYARKSDWVGFQYDPVYIKHIFKETLPFWIALFLGVVYFKVDVILLSILEPENIHNVSIALYSLPMKIIEVGMVFGTVYLNSLLPVLSSHHLSQEKKHRVTHTAWLLLSILGSIISIGFAFGAYQVIGLIASSEYIKIGSFYDSPHTLMITAWIFAVYFIASLSNYLLINANRQKELLKINIAITLLNIGLNLILIPHYSFIGAAVATLISQIILTLATLSRLRWMGIYSSMPIRRYLEVFASSLLCVIILGWICKMIPNGIVWLITIWSIILLVFSPVLIKWWKYNSETTLHVS